jgi:hypothetical protein
MDQRQSDRRARVACLVLAGAAALASAASHPAAAQQTAVPDAATRGAGASAPRPPAQADRIAASGVEMAEAADRFLAALTPEQKEKASFELKDDERLNWHFVPRERKGVSIKEMAPEQRALAHALLSSGLSHRGYAVALNIMSLEQILRDMEKGSGPARDPEQYFFSVFGRPAATGTWAWRVEGHHLSLNFTLVDGKPVSGGPNFMGTNPGEVREGARKGLRVLGREEDLGRQLVKALDETQRKTAVISADAPKEILTGNARKASLEKFEGIAAADLAPPQREMLMALVEGYARRLRDEMAEQDLRKIVEAGPQKIYFAWSGELEPGRPHYYRIHGPTFLVEYDNTQNNANHVHTAWRDLQNDFGEDALRRHYEQNPGDAHGHDHGDAPKGEAKAGT